MVLIANKLLMFTIMFLFSIIPTVIGGGIWWADALHMGSAAKRMACIAFFVGITLMITGLIGANVWAN